MEWVALGLLLVNLLSAGYGVYSQYQTNKDMLNFTREENDRYIATQKELQQQMLDYQSPVNQVNLYKEAGLNTGLLYGNQSLANMSPSLPNLSRMNSPQLTSPGFQVSHGAEQITDSLINTILAKNQLRNTEIAAAEAQSRIWKNAHEIKNIDMDTYYKGKQSAKVVADTISQKIQNNLNLRFGETDRMLDQTMKYLSAQQISANTAKVLTEEQLLQLQKKYTNAQINQAVFDYQKDREIWDKCSEEIMRSYQLENEGKYQQAKETEYRAKELFYKTQVFDSLHSYAPTDGYVGAAISTASILGRYNGMVIKKVKSWFGD